MSRPKDKRTHPKLLADPLPEVICVAVLTVILLLTGYVDVPVGL